jgi:hypothetical protein
MELFEGLKLNSIGEHSVENSRVLRGGGQFTYSSSCCLISLLTLIAICATVRAQNRALVDFRGQVVDQAGSVVMAARVSLMDARKAARTENTGGDGRFVFTGISAGRYQLTVEAAGFARHQEAITIGQPPREPVKIALYVAPLKGEVEIDSPRGGLSTESGANANAIVLRGRMIQRLPRTEEQLRLFLERMAGSFAGKLEISVNGMAGAGLPPASMIKEIRINNDPFSAEHHEPGSARVEIETKGGDAQTQASVYFNYRNRALDARNAFAESRPPLEYRDLGGWWSSRLFGPRSFIFALYERQRHDEASPITAYLPEGAFKTIVPTPSRNSIFNLRTDFLPSDRQTISVLFSQDRGWQRGPEITSVDLPERSYDIRPEHQSLQASWRRIFSANLINESQLRVARDRSASATDNFAPSIEVAGAFNGGGPQCCPERSASERLSVADNLTINSGRHLIKTGVSFGGAHVSELSQRDFGGTYYYGSLSLYRLRRPVIYTISAGEPRLGFGLWQFAAYAQDEIRVKPGFTLSPGLRYETQTHISDRNNFAPRLGFAWSPFKSQSTIVRGGAGVFYQQLEEDHLSQALRYDGARQRQVIIVRPRLPDPLGGRPIDSFPSSINQLDPNLRTPYQMQTSIGIERRLVRDLVLTATYDFIRGVRLFRSRDINAPLPGENLRPRPELGRIATLESSSTSTYHGLTIGFSQSLGDRFSFFGNYTLSRTMDDADGPDAFPMDSYNLAIERGFSARDERHQFFFGALLALPGGLEASPMIYYNTGRPYNITTGFDDNNDSSITDRPAGVPRNSGRGPDFATFDLRMSRSFSFSRQGSDRQLLGFEIAADAINLFNRVNFSDFNGIQTSPFFGRANAAHNPRQISLQLTFYFH